MTRGTVYYRAVGNILAVVDENGPNLDEDEEAEISELLERENKREDVIGHALEEAVNRVEGDRGVWGRHDPLVVGLVQGLVDERVVQTAVDEVYEAVGEEDKEWKLEDVVPHARSVLEAVV